MLRSLSSAAAAAAAAADDDDDDDDDDGSINLMTIELQLRIQPG